MKPTITALILILFAVFPSLGFQQKAQEPLTRYSPEQCGMSLELPVQSAPSIIKTPIPQNLQDKILYTNSSFIQVGEMQIIYAHMSAIQYLQPKSIAEGAIHEIIRSSGIVDSQFLTEPSTDTQAPIKGTLKMNGVEIEVNGLTFSKDKHNWSVVCVYKKSNKEAQELGQRILASIKLDGAPCPEK